MSAMLIYLLINICFNECVTDSTPNAGYIVVKSMYLFPALIKLLSWKYRIFKNYINKQIFRKKKSMYNKLFICI